MEYQAGRNMTAHFTSRQLLTLPSPGMCWSQVSRLQRCCVTAVVHLAYSVPCARTQITALVSVP